MMSIARSFALHNPDWMTEEYHKELEEAGVAHMQEDIRKIGKAEFFKTTMRTYAEARLKGSP